METPERKRPSKVTQEKIERRSFLTRRGVRKRSIPKELTSVVVEHFDDSDDPCVYFLIRRAKVVYVGQTRCLAARVKTHKTNGKGFDTVLFTRCSPEILNGLEQSFIKFFRPELSGPRQYAVSYDDIQNLLFAGVRLFKIKDMQGASQKVIEMAAEIDRQKQSREQCLNQKI